MNARPLRIVLIEDNPADVYLIEQALRGHGIEFELVRHANGDDALQHCCPGPGVPLDPPDLFLLDLHLPGTEGHDVLRAIRAEPRLRHVPVAILSGADPARLRRTDLNGSNLLVHKSMDLDTFTRALGEGVLQLFPRREWFVPEARAAAGEGKTRPGDPPRTRGGRARPRKMDERSPRHADGVE